MLNVETPPTSILYQTLSAAFCVIVVLSNIISVKMVQLPYMIGFSIPAGLVTYPLTFLLSDLVTELFGAKKAKLMVYIALVMSVLSFGIIQIALLLPPSTEGEQTAFKSVLGLSNLRIFSSLTAYIFSQVIGIQLYAWIKKQTGSRFLWIRNNGSTFASQLIDTLLIDIIYLYWGLGMTWIEVLPITVISYAYKVFFSLVNTPLLYLSLFLIRFKWKTSALILHFKRNKSKNRISYSPSNIETTS